MNAPLPVPRVLVVHRHTLVGKALCKLLTSESQFNVVGDARSAEEANIDRLRPDLLLLDFDGREGRLEQSVAACKAASPKTRIILLTSHYGHSAMQRSLACGLDGYILTDIEPVELRLACATVARGDSYFDPRVSGVLLRRLHSARGGDDELSLREGEILSLIAAGLSNRDIGARLTVSEKTVKNNITCIFSKLGITARTHAAVYAIRNGFA
jgi:two-component system, NarL family, response regulator DevR